jgi:hypothetical protein
LTTTHTLSVFHKKNWRIVSDNSSPATCLRNNDDRCRHGMFGEPGISGNVTASSASSGRRLLGTWRQRYRVMAR